MARAVRIQAPSRLHFGLVDVGGATRRSFGGAGCFIESPCTRIGFVPIARRLRVGSKTDEHLRSDIQASLDLLIECFPNAIGEVEIVETPLAHAGFGSKTAAVLGALKCAALGNEIQVEDEELKRLSRRGGASGIGIHGFFEGGAVVDGGHEGRPDGPWLPSGASDPDDLPLKIARLKVPAGWIFHLMLPPGNHVSGEAERAFFENVTPIQDSEVLKTLAAIWHGVVPAVLKADLSLFRVSLKDLSLCGLKKREIEAQPDSYALIESIDRNLNLPVGMSSMGPLVFSVSTALDHSGAQLKALCEDMGAQYLGGVSPANHGFLVA